MFRNVPVIALLACAAILPALDSRAQFTIQELPPPGVTMSDSTWISSRVVSRDGAWAVVGVHADTGEDCTWYRWHRTDNSLTTLSAPPSITAGGQTRAYAEFTAIHTDGTVYGTMYNYSATLDDWVDTMPISGAVGSALVLLRAFLTSGVGICYFATARKTLSCVPTERHARAASRFNPWI